MNINLNYISRTVPLQFILPEQLLHLESLLPAELREESSSTGSHFSFQQEQNKLRELVWFRPSAPSTGRDHFPSL